MGHVPSRCVVGERENIPGYAIEVTPESPALAQGEKKKKVMTAEKKSEVEKFAKAPRQMERARSVSSCFLATFQPRCRRLARAKRKREKKKKEAPAFKRR